MKKLYVALCPFLGAEGMVRPGQVLELDSDRAQELMKKSPPLVVPEGEYEGELLAEAAQPIVEGETQTITPEALEARRLELEAKQRAAEDASLSPFSKGGGWFHFPVDGGDTVKAQGRALALAELGRREAAADAGQQS